MIEPVVQVGGIDTTRQSKSTGLAVDYIILLVVVAQRVQSIEIGEFVIKRFDIVITGTREVIQRCVLDTLWK